MKFGTWFDYYTSSDRWEDENLAPMNLIELLASLDPDKCMRNVLEFSNLVALIVNQSTDKLVIIYHISKAGKSLKSQRKQRKL